MESMVTTSYRAICAMALLLSAGCSIHYERHHQTDILRLYHNAGHPPHGLDTRWANMALRTLALDMGVELEDVSPVDVYVDCDESSTRPSRFNRFTKSIVLRVGQADLPWLFVHEATHLLLDRIDGSPGYWIDQGLAEYMESRCSRADPDGLNLLLPPFLERDADELAHIGTASGDEVVRRVTQREAIDQGWSWAVPFIHYLVKSRWADRPLAQRVRTLLRLSAADVLQLAPAFIEFCRGFDPAREFLEDYRGSPVTIRLALLGELHWRFHGQRVGLFDRLLSIEKDPALLRLIASGRLIVSPPAEVGATFNAVAAVLHPDSVPGLDQRRSRALVSHLLEDLKMTPADWRFPMVATLIARRSSARDLSLERIVEWLEIWPREMAPFATRADVQEYFSTRLWTVSLPLLEVLLDGMPVADEADADVVERSRMTGIPVPAASRIR